MLQKIFKFLKNVLDFLINKLDFFLNFFKNYLQENLKKSGFSLKWVKMIFCFWHRLKQAESFFEVKMYFNFKKIYIRNSIGYYQGLFEYYSDRVYEDDSEHKFNERIWIADLNNIKHAINSYLYKEFLDFLHGPLKYIKESFIVVSFLENFKFWRQLIPFMFFEIYIIFLEVFYSFYLNHDEEAFYKAFSLTKPKEIVKSDALPPIFEDFIIDLSPTRVDEEKKNEHIKNENSEN